MNDAYYFLQSMLDNGWSALSSVTVPVLNVPFLILFLAIFLFNMVMKVVAVITGGSQDKEPSGHGMIDNNNHYIYKLRGKK